MRSAVAAAVDVAVRYGVPCRAPLVLQETNNTVVWLRPAPVVAKVATRADAADGVRLEHALAAELAAAGAEIARPLAGAEPRVHPETGFVVTLWERLEGDVRVAVPADALAGSLQRLHAALATLDRELPPFRQAIARARAALDVDAFMTALADDDRRLLRDVYDRELEALDRTPLRSQPLHGEPHDGNRLLTADGIRWIDLESCCTGPVEWDLAFQPPPVVEHFPEADADLLAVLRRLNSARVATWCWSRAQLPEMRRHGEMHLAILRAARGAP